MLYKINQLVCFYIVYSLITRNQLKSAVGLCSPQKRTPTITVSIPGGGEIVMRYLAPLNKVLYTAITYVDPASNGYIQTFFEWRSKWIVKTTKHGLDIIQSCSDLASHWFRDIELESVIAVWACIILSTWTHSRSAFTLLTYLFSYNNAYAITHLFKKIINEQSLLKWKIEFSLFLKCH